LGRRRESEVFNESAAPGGANPSFFRMGTGFTALKCKKEGECRREARTRGRKGKDAAGRRYRPVAKTGFRGPCP